MLSGLNRWNSPSARHWYWPPDGSSVCSARLRSANAAVWRISTSRAITSRPTPPTRDDGAREVFVDDVLAQADGFEHLRAVIALHGGDAHLGHDLHDALDRGLREILAGQLVLDARQHLVADHAVQRFEREVRD